MLRKQMNVHVIYLFDITGCIFNKHTFEKQLNVHFIVFFMFNAIE